MAKAFQARDQGATEGGSGAATTDPVKNQQGITGLKLDELSEEIKQLLVAQKAATNGGTRACFGAGTPLLVPGGSKPIESFRAGDLVLSRDEFDWFGAVETKVVEEVFERFGRIVHLHAGGQVIVTTPEHPFWVVDRGAWVPAFEILPNERLIGHDGQSVVEEVYDTGEYAAVYNLRIADHHTYFVGCDEWGWDVWAHNTYAAFIAAVVQGSNDSPKRKERRRPPLGKDDALFAVDTGKLHQLYNDFYPKVQEAKQKGSGLDDLSNSFRSQLAKVAGPLSQQSIVAAWDAIVERPDTSKPPVLSAGSTPKQQAATLAGWLRDAIEADAVAKAGPKKQAYYAKSGAGAVHDNFTATVGIIFNPQRSQNEIWVTTSGITSLAGSIQTNLIRGAEAAGLNIVIYTPSDGAISGSPQITKEDLKKQNHGEQKLFRLVDAAAQVTKGTQLLSFDSTNQMCANCLRAAFGKFLDLHSRDEYKTTEAKAVHAGLLAQGNQPK